jgi:phosphoenolpyruvate carboxykinase (GTP)
MAMQPFAGYNFGDYWQHWLTTGSKLKAPPQVFHVNWFRRDAQGRFLWPGYGDNLRVLRWMIDRCMGRVGSRETAIGHLPVPTDLDLGGLAIDATVLQELLAVRPDAWRAEMAAVGEYLDGFGTRVPAQLRQQLGEIVTRLG